MRVLVAPDKFRGTITAHQVCVAVARAARHLGHECVQRPLADGGEGTLAVLGGANRVTTVTGPLGYPVGASWRYHDHVAVIEMAQASGLALAGGREKNLALDATTAGTGELIRHAISAGARRIVVCLGGSATTDGGLGALDAIGGQFRLKGIELVVACDVSTKFVEASAVFAPQKGASPAQVSLLTRRLESLVDTYQTRFGVDVGALEGGGAAGGLAGALWALGGVLRPGFDVVADHVGLTELVDTADFVITGEGHLDAESFHGKVVGSVALLCDERNVTCAAIVGDIDVDVMPRIRHVSLVQMFGREQAMWATEACIEDAAIALLSGSPM